MYCINLDLWIQATETNSDYFRRERIYWKTWWSSQNEQKPGRLDSPENPEKGSRKHGIQFTVGTAGQDATVTTAATSASQKPLIRPQSLSFPQYLMFPTGCLIGLTLRHPWRNSRRGKTESSPLGENPTSSQDYLTEQVQFTKSEGKYFKK